MLDLKKELRSDYDGSIDWESIDAVIEEFLDAPEGQPFKEEGVAYLGMMFDYALSYNSSTAGNMTKGNISEVIFELFPRKVSMDPEDAPEVIAECRAFWQFMARQYRHQHGGAIAAMLDYQAVTRLRKELADPRNFGMAKSFFMQGQQEGFDMTSEAGMKEFMNVYNDRLMGNPHSPLPLPPFPIMGMLPPDAALFEVGDGQTPKHRAEARAKKRKARKNAKKSRKRNR